MTSPDAHPQRLTFRGLDPRKAKRRSIDHLLLPLGKLTWQRMPALRLTGYPQTKARAQAAFDAARRPASGKVISALQRLLYGWQYNGTRAYFERHKDTVGVAWNGLNGSRRAFMDGVRDAGARTLFFELAPFKDRITCDPVGVNQLNSLPREAGFYRDWMARSGLAADGWRSMREEITQRTPARDKPSGDDAPTGPYLFVPLQVPGDSQLRLFGGQFKTVPDFIDALIVAAEALPEGWHLKIKEHPTADISYAHLITGKSARVVLDNVTDTFTQVAGSSGVVTVNSSVGLEAMFFDKPVVACGQCFWALTGVAMSASDAASLAGIFAEPEALQSDPATRGAFLSYLLEEYYVLAAGGPNEARKIVRKLGQEVAIDTDVEAEA